jgi:hypothetical protein
MQGPFDKRPSIRGFPHYVVPGLILIEHQLWAHNDFFKAVNLWEKWAREVGPTIEQKLTAKEIN